MLAQKLYSAASTFMPQAKIAIIIYYHYSEEFFSFSEFFASATQKSVRSFYKDDYFNRKIVIPT